MNAGDVLRQVADLVGGDRQQTHGDIEEVFSRIAVLWNAYLAIRRDPAAPLGPVDVAQMMVLLKVARTQAGTFNPDDFHDQAGYAALGAEMAEREEKVL